MKFCQFWQEFTKLCISFCAAFAHLFSVFSSKVKIILSKYSAIVIHKLLVKSLIVNNCVVGLGLTCARFSGWKDSYFSLLAQLSEPKSNPRPKMKENVSYQNTKMSPWYFVQSAHSSETDFCIVIIKNLQHFC